jgi:hypothetical protein
VPLPYTPLLLALLRTACPAQPTCGTRRGCAAKAVGGGIPLANMWLGVLGPALRERSNVYRYIRCTTKAPTTTTPVRNDAFS